MPCRPARRYGHGLPRQPRLGRAQLPGWPGALDGPGGAAVLSVATWTGLVRLTLADAAEHGAWRALARAERAAGAPAWLTAVAASERLAGPGTPCPAVRVRHLAAVRRAAGEPLDGALPGD